MSFMHRIRGRRAFPLPPFDLTPLEFAMDEEDELLLDQVFPAGGDPSRAVPMVVPVPTAGELHASIERHLKALPKLSEAKKDASEELRDALAELRRSLG